MLKEIMGRCKECKHWDPSFEEYQEQRGTCDLVGSVDGEPIYSGSFAQVGGDKQGVFMLFTQPNYGCVQFDRK